MNIVQKIKDIGKQTPITKDAVKMLAITGRVCTIEQRTSDFISKINEMIIEKAKLSRFKYMAEVPEDLIPQIKAIQKDFESRGFSVYPVDDILIINWK